MSEQLSFYKLFSEKHYDIVIPIVQRDYAQGRKSAESVRTDFLEALHNYLDEGIPFRDLDFIYGDIDEHNNFIPLDGQQRLTTLFLLHWYLALKEGRFEDLRNILSKNGYSRFTYKTRQSAADFCNALLNHTIDLNQLLPNDKGKENCLSKTIKNSFWYYLSWNRDPTVRSMLRMLDAIHSKFKNTIGFYELLVNSERPIVTFQFLELKNYGLTNDLYIKMNSRGKPLTDFENFKAKFEQHLQGMTGVENYEPSLKEYFAQRIDTKWAALFWEFRDKAENVIDDRLMNFISALAINHYALSNSNPKKYIDKQDRIPLKFYLKLDSDFVRTLVDTLDLLSSDRKYKKFLKDFHYYDEVHSFTRVIKNDFSDSGFVERIKFFAYYSFLVKWKESVDSDKFENWMRVIVNLTENTTPYNSEFEFVNSLKAVVDLLPHSGDILKYLSTGRKVRGFNSNQITDEQIKANLFLKSENWKQVILNAEKSYEYFKGQLIFAFAFSGIEKFFNEHGNCNWEERDDKKYFDLFNEYLLKTSSLFGIFGLKKDAEHDHRLHRALLSKGNYLISAKSNLSFLNNSDRDVSWKRFLQGDSERLKKRKFLKKVLDDPLFDPSNLKSLDDIARNSKEDLEEWQTKFVGNPKLFEYLGSPKYIRFENKDEIYLLKGVKRSGEHCELFTYALYLQLEGNLNFQPLTKMSYNFANRDNNIPHFSIRGMIHKKNELVLSVFYFKLGKFKIQVNIDGNIDVRLTKILNELHFVEKPSSFHVYLDEKKVKPKIEDLCKRIKESVENDI
jgi:hypothetical protein